VEEKQVIEAFLETRSEEAFCALFEAVSVRVSRYFLLRGLDTPTAEDMTQNVFLKLYRQSGELRDSNRFYGWLFAIARNELISYWRREGRSERVEYAPLAEQYPGGLAIDPGVLPAMLIKELLEVLEPAERDLVVLRFVEGLSYEELTVALNMPLGTVKWRIFNARKKLSRIVRASPAAEARERIN
jgi:RNA polymerase sigma-70 factor (ECF subfamily)